MVIFPGLGVLTSSSPTSAFLALGSATCKVSSGGSLHELLEKSIIMSISVKISLKWHFDLPSRPVGRQIGVHSVATGVGNAALRRRHVACRNPATVLIYRADETRTLSRLAAGQRIFQNPAGHLMERSRKKKHSASSTLFWQLNIIYQFIDHILLLTF